MLPIKHNDVVSNGLQRRANRDEAERIVKSTVSYERLVGRIDKSDSHDSTCERSRLSRQARSGSINTLR
jgi:hypothetical protein